MPPFDFGTQEQRMLWASALLGIVHLVLYVVFSGVAGRTGWEPLTRLDTPFFWRVP